MKKMFFSSMLILLTVTVFAQPGHHQPGERPTSADRWKRDSIKLQLYVKMSTAQSSAVKPVFLSFYKTLDAQADPGKMPLPSRESIGKAIKERGEALKKIFDQPQMDRFETFEREFMPPPPPPQHAPNEML